MKRDRKIQRWALIIIFMGSMGVFFAAQATIDALKEIEAKRRELRKNENRAGGELERKALNEQEENSGVEGFGVLQQDKRRKEGIKRLRLLTEEEQELIMREFAYSLAQKRAGKKESLFLSYIAADNNLGLSYKS